MRFSKFDVTRRTRKGAFKENQSVNGLELHRVSNHSPLCTGIKCSRSSGVLRIAVILRYCWLESGAVSLNDESLEDDVSDHWTFCVVAI